MDQEIKDEFKKVHTAVANLSATVEQLAQSTAKGFADMDKRLELLEDRFGTLEQRFAGLEQRFAGLERRVTAIEKRLEKLPEELTDKVDDTYGEMLNAHEDRIRALETA